MSTAIDEQLSSQERQRIFSELRSLRQDTQAFRTEAYRLRTAGSLDAATNERLRAQQQELEQRGTALITQYARCYIPLFCSAVYLRVIGSISGANGMWSRTRVCDGLRFTDISVSSAVSLFSQRQRNGCVIRESTAVDCWELSSAAGLKTQCFYFWGGFRQSAPWGSYP
jgi:hypothetical protein